VRDLLIPRAEVDKQDLVPTLGLELTADVSGMDLGARLRGRIGPLSVHQLICALIDFPDREPPGVVVEKNRQVVDGALTVWAASEAGRCFVKARGRETRLSRTTS
jgi:hypothetical protein